MEKNQKYGESNKAGDRYPIIQRHHVTAAQSIEHQRKWSEKGWNNAIRTRNYDCSRESLNFEIKKGGIPSPVDKRKNIPQLMAENLAGRGIRDLNEGREIPKY